METFHTLRSNNANLAAVWHSANGPGAPVVIFHHGFSGTKVEAHRIFVKCARQLTENGFDAFRFDFFGSGDSDGDLSDATLSIWIQNALDAAAYVTSKGKKQIVFLGFSIGAFVAAAAAARIAPLGLALWAPIFHPLKRILRESALIDQARKSGFADYQGEIVKYKLVEDAARFTIPNMYVGYKNPICIIHGTADESARLWESTRFAKLYRAQGANVESHAVKGANHSFDRHDWEDEVIRHTLRWMLQLPR